MRAILVDAPGDLRVVDVPEPEPRLGEVVVDVAYAGICGSDVEILAGRRPPGFVRYPVVPGHEWSGTVAAVADGGDRSLIGRKVVGEGFRSCHVCAPCDAGDFTLCEADYDETGFTRPGAWAEQLVVPAELLHPLDPGADLRSAAGLEPAACAADAVRRARIDPATRVAVVGGGTIGLLTVQLVHIVAPRELVVVEPDAGRADLALRLGATEVYSAGDVRKPREGFDIVIEAAGAPDTARLSLELARRGGRVVLTGIPDASAAILVRDIVAKRLEIATVFGAPRQAWHDAVAAFEAGTLAPGSLVTHEIPLVHALSALELVAGRDPSVGKVLLVPSREHR